MYKDKDRQRATTRDRVRRYRAKHKAVTPKACNAQMVTPCVTPKVTPCKLEPVTVTGGISMAEYYETKGPEPQSHSPMMVGYVPPKD